MTKEEAKMLIVSVVESCQGCKAMELTSKEKLWQVIVEFHLNELLEELIRDKQLIEVEYILSSMSYRTKSFLLPGGTKVSVNE